MYQMFRVLARRLYDAGLGSISVEGISARRWNVMALRDSVAIVGQESILSNYNIGENIAYGKTGAAQLKVEEDADIYNIATLPILYLHYWSTKRDTRQCSYM